MAVIQTKIVTMRFDPRREVFDDEGVRRWLATRRLIRAVPHFFVHHGEPYWTVYLEASTGELPVQFHNAPVPVAADLVSGETLEKPKSKDESTNKRLKALKGVHKERYERIRQWRKETAVKEGVPHYIILTNRQILEVVEAAPRTLAGLREVRGLGQKRVARHGAKLLEVLHGPVSSSRPQSAQALSAVDGVQPVVDGADPEVAKEPASQPDPSGGVVDAGDS